MNKSCQSTSGSRWSRNGSHEHSSSKSDQCFLNWRGPAPVLQVFYSMSEKVSSSLRDFALMKMSFSFWILFQRREIIVIILSWSSCFVNHSHDLCFLSAARENREFSFWFGVIRLLSLCDVTRILSRLLFCFRFGIFLRDIRRKKKCPSVNPNLPWSIQLNCSWYRYRQTIARNRVHRVAEDTRYPDDARWRLYLIVWNSSISFFFGGGGGDGWSDRYSVNVRVMTRDESRHGSLTTRVSNASRSLIETRNTDFR